MTQTVATTGNTDKIQPLSLIIVSGRSGSGKTSVINILEDFGYYAIDNLPLSLVMEAVNKLSKDSHIRKIALGIDVRSVSTDLLEFATLYDELHRVYGQKNGHDSVKVIYTTAQDGILVARFDATRRIHPLMASIRPLMQHSNNLPNALQQEVALLAPIASRADITIDTSCINIHELKQQVSNHLGIENCVTVNILSFGFKYGNPIDSDFVFDVRTLPNPHWEEDLRNLTGLDTPIHEFFASYPEVEEMGQDIGQFLARWLPECLHNNRHTVTIAIGCTGGKHRSVFISQMLVNLLKNKLPTAMKVVIKHREKSRW